MVSQEKAKTPGWLEKAFSKKLKILFWDDEADGKQKELFRKIEDGIKNFGWLPTITPDKEKAKVIALKDNFDVIVLDLLENGKPVGVEFLKYIREEKPFLPIIMFSIVSEMEFIHSNYRGEVSYYLTKPIRNHHEVIRAVEVAVEIEKAKEKVFHDKYYASIGELAAGVSHFIKNSLWNIGSRAQYLLDKTDKNDEAYELLEIINKRCDDANKVVVDLLNYAKRKNHKAKKKRTNIVEIIYDVLKLLTHELKYHNITVDRKVTSDNVIIMGDEFELKEAFLNIIKNAVEAMSDGGMLKIEVSSLDNMIIIRISDTGEGMSKETIESLFMPFYTTKQGAVGFGLFEANRIIRNHEGIINAESEPGKGSTFTIDIPFVP
jgi:signal transduction histidine kinase